MFLFLTAHNTLSEFFSSLNYSFITPGFSFIVVVWGQWVLLVWKQEETSLAVSWGMVGTYNAHIDEIVITKEVVGTQQSKNREESRSHFQNNITISVGGSDTCRKIMQFIYSITLLIFVTFVALISVYFTCFLRMRCGEVIAFFVYGTVSHMLNFVYVEMSCWLLGVSSHSGVPNHVNSRETADKAEAAETADALLVTVFLSQFITSTALLFYLAFWRMLVGDSCGTDGCTHDLFFAALILLGIIHTTKLKLFF